MATNAAVSAGDYEVSPGEEFTVTVYADQLDDVLSYAFRLSYDTSLLNVTDFSVGDYLSACGNAFTMPVEEDGLVGVDAACLGATVSSGTTFATVTFTALTTGSCSLDISGSDISLRISDDIIPVNLTEDDGSVTVEAVTAEVSTRTYNVTQANPFRVTVSASQLDDVLGYSFRLSYDQSLLNVTQVTVGNYLSSCEDLFSVPVEGDGSIGLDAACLGDTVTSGTTFAVITFQPLATGNSTLDIYGSNISVGLDSSYQAVVTEVDGLAIVHAVTQSDGDADGDGHVTFNDFVTLAFSYSSSSGDTRFDPNADFNGDGVVNYEDLLILAMNYEF